MAKIRKLKVSTGQENGKTSIRSLAEIEEFADRLGPEFPFFTLFDPTRGFVQAMHYETMAVGPDINKSAATFCLECSDAPKIIHQTFTDNVHEIADFMKNWASNKGGWRTTISQWKILDFHGRLNQKAE